MNVSQGDSSADSENNQEMCIYEGQLINSQNSPLINSFLHQITQKLVYK